MQMKKAKQILVASLLCVLCGSSVALAFVAPLRDVQTGVEGSGDQQRVWFRVYDPVKKSWESGYSSQGRRAELISVQDGVVVWTERDPYRVDTEWHACCAVYDPGTGDWERGGSGWHDAVNVRQNRHGVVAWVEKKPSVDKKWRAAFATYDPRDGRWRYGGGWWYDGADVHACQDGVVAWLDREDSKGRKWQVGYAIYDPVDQDWAYGGTLWGRSASIVSIDQAIVTYTVEADHRSRGYDHDQGWYSGPTTALASLAHSGNSGEAPFTVWFTDMSIGATSCYWNFGDGGGSAERSTWHVYERCGLFTAVQSVSGPAGQDSASVTIETDQGKPSCSVVINDGKPYVASRSVTLTMSASDDSGVVSHMRFSHDGSMWTPWEPYATTKAWQLTDGDGKEWVWAQVRDAAQRESDPDSDSRDAIVLDTKCPEPGSVNATVSGRDVRLCWIDFSDGTSGIDRYELYYRKPPDRTWIMLYSGLKQCYNHLGLDPCETYEYLVQAIDRAGNRSVGARAEVVITCPRLTLTVKSIPVTGIPITGDPAGTTDYEARVHDNSLVSLTPPWQVEGYFFMGWRDPQGRTVTHCGEHSFHINQDTTLIAEYDRVTDFYVNDEIAEPGIAPGDDCHPGTSPAAPMRHIQALLERYPRIGAGCTVHVSAGEFVEQVIPGADHSGLTFEGAGPEVTTIGGPEIEACFWLDGFASGKITGFTISKGAGEYAPVACFNGSSPIIKGNRLAGSSSRWGGAIYCEESSPRIVDNVITGNYANNAGAIYCYYASPRIKRNLISRNSAQSTGGAIRCSHNSCPIIAENTIVGNTAGDQGGAIRCLDNSAVVIKDNVISANGSTYGGGIHVTASGPVITRNVICGNSAVNGGGIYCHKGTDVTITNNVITGNSANAGGGVYCHKQSVVDIINDTVCHNSGIGIYSRESSLAIVNCIVWENDEDFDGCCPSYSCITEDMPGAGNIVADPRFRDRPAGNWTDEVTFDGDLGQCTLVDVTADWEEGALEGLLLNPNTSQTFQFVIASNTATTITVWGKLGAIAGTGDPYQVLDYHLQRISPCIDAGTREGAPRKDIDLEPRPQGGGVDMGADEYVSTGTIFGIVTDQETALPIEDAEVTLVPRGRRQDPALPETADSEGWYGFADVKPGKYRAIVKQTGYRPVKRRVKIRGRNRSERRDFQLRPKP